MCAIHCIQQEDSHEEWNVQHVAPSSVIFSCAAWNRFEPRTVTTSFYAGCAAWETSIICRYCGCHTLLHAEICAVLKPPPGCALTPRDSIFVVSQTVGSIFLCEGTRNLPATTPADIIVVCLPHRTEGKSNGVYRIEREQQTVGFTNLIERLLRGAPEHATLLSCPIDNIMLHALLRGPVCSREPFL